jgi:hypothetical protein
MDDEVIKSNVYLERKLLGTVESELQLQPWVRVASFARIVRLFTPFVSR